MPTAQEYRDALDALEMAVGELEIVKLVNGWGDPRHNEELGAKLPTTCGTVYRLYDAYIEANRLMNEHGRED